MIEIEKRGGKKYQILTKEEFDNSEFDNLVVVDRFESVENADYVISSDGYYVPILKVYSLGKDKKQFYYRTPLGNYFPFTGRGDPSPIKFINGMNNNGDSPLRPGQKKFAEVYAKTWDKRRAVEEGYPNTKYKDIVKLNIANKLLKLKKVQNFVDELTRKAMVSLDVDHQWVLAKLKSIVDSGENDNVKLSALKEFIEIMQLKKKLSVKTTHTLPISNDDLMRITGKPTGKLAEYSITEETD